ncbi:expressed unknown protein [Ectocarpus siliculosus]|uniref:Sfi1 spindle body domain-containing protein n=1 Tax=Ectocarpus siliculosus TaxID=2880 RepID=D7G1G4_ECTSI|nr:expressed unknown protein [Ectocarpus siliculosus]|eukprot:CBJ26772.1 expressed unknown protein [Ectocarpus siliculosus]
MPRATRKPVQVEGVGLARRQQQGESASAALDDAAAQQRLRRLRRKRLAEKVVAHWKDFAREGIAEARARAHASAAPRRRGLTRWRAGATALRSTRHRRTADAGRWRFLAESRGFATWLAATRATRDRRRREETAAAAAAAAKAAAAERVLTKIARSSLQRWAAWAAGRRARRDAGNEACVHASSLLPGKLRRAIRRWRQHCANRQQFRRILTDVATVPRPPPAFPRRGAPPTFPCRAPPPTPPPPPPAPTTAEAFATAGRARAASFLRRWRRAATRRRRTRASAGLARRFRDHVLLLRHHEHWKAFVAGKRAAAELEAAAARLGRRARTRRALLGLSRAAEASAEERDRVRPVLREAFSKWDKACADGLRKRECREEEARERDRRTRRRVLRAWLCRTRNSVDARGQVVEGERHRRERCLRRAVRGWARAGLESRRRRGQATASRKHADRRRLASGVRVWRVAAAGMASRRSAKRVAMDKDHIRYDNRRRGKVAALFRPLARVSRVVPGRHGYPSPRGRARPPESSGKVLGGLGGGSRVAVAEAGRREREKVSAALLLWKLHTQGKAFAALAAHRLRRRWKQDRARRAVGWRRERLIKDGALRWAATADALSASRISSTAFREGNRAARRWEAAGRCARHWRRVAAARGMQRRARDQFPRTSVAPMPGFPGDVPGDVARGCVAVRDGEIIAESGGVRFPRGGGGSRARRPDVATATGRTSSLRMAAGVGVDEENVRLSSGGPVEEGGAAAPGEEFTPVSGGPAREEKGRLSPLSVRGLSGQGEEEEEENEHRTSPPPMTVGNLTQAACPLPAAASEPPWGRTQPGSGVDAGVDGGSPGGGGDFGGGGGAGRRRPAPRRPLELLLDETSRFAATASENRGQRGGGVAPPLSTWVVDEMNRLFGAGGSVNNGLAVAGGGSSAVVDGDRGRRERAAMFRSAGHVDCGQSGQVACLPGRDGGGRSKDSDGQLFAPIKSTFWGSGRGEMASASGPGSAPFRRAASPSVGQWERRAGTRGNQQQGGLLQHPTEVSSLPATARPPQPPPSQEDTTSTSGGGVRGVYGAPTAASCTCQCNSPAPPSCARPTTPQFDGEMMPLPVDVGSPLAAAPALPAGEAGAGGAFEATEASPSSPESIADSTVASSSAAQQQWPTSVLSFDGAATAYETEEADLEARVAKAERRLRALQERARQRHRDKRELAALHQALAEQEARTTHDGVGSRGNDGGEMGGGIDCPVDGNRKPSKALLSSAADNRGNNNAVGQGDFPSTISNSSHSAVEPGNEEGPTPASIGAPHSLDVTTPAQTALLSLDGNSSEHETATDTSSRRALLVRMGMIRARLDSGGKVRAEGGWLRPVAESLRREVEELAKSGAAGRSRSGSGGP